MKSTVKTISKISIITLAMAFSFGVYASDLNTFDGTTCASKKQAIETQIDYAKKNNNTHRVQGLEKALSDVNAYCTNDSLEAKYKERVQEKTNKVAEREQELAEAKAKGDMKKIAKQEAKLQENKAELSEAQTKLAEFYKDLKSN